MMKKVRPLIIRGPRFPASVYMIGPGSPISISAGVITQAFSKPKMLFSRSEFVKNVPGT